MALVAISVAGQTRFGDMTSFGGLAAAFDGVTNIAGTGSAAKTFSNTGDGYVGTLLAAAKVIRQAIIYGSNGVGFVSAVNPSTTLQLYGKLGSNPANATDGTLLGTLTFTDTANESAGRTINVSNTGTYDRVWTRVTHVDTTARATGVVEILLWEPVPIGDLAAAESGSDVAAFSGTFVAAPPGGFFSPVIEAIAEGHSVHAALFVENHFNAATSRNWTGLGIVHIAGQDWIGTGELVKLGALQFGGDDAAPGLTMTLSGVDPAFVAEARTMPSVHGLEQRIYLQFFDADSLAPVGDFYELDRRYLDVIGYSITGPGAAAISLSSESEWTGLNTAAYQDWSDPDQEALFAGDRGLEFLGDLVYGQRIDWPDFSDSG